MFVPILFASLTGFYQLQGKYSSQGACDDVMVFPPICSSCLWSPYNNKDKLAILMCFYLFLVIRSDIM